MLISKFFDSDILDKIKKLSISDISYLDIHQCEKLLDYRSELSNEQLKAFNDRCDKLTTEPKNKNFLAG